MAEEGKKISFGFAKSIKKPVLKNTVPQEKKKVDYIECLDDKAIKVIGGEEKEDEPLVIPLIGSKTWHDRILNKVDADIFEPKLIKSEPNETNDGSIEDRGQQKLSNGNAALLKPPGDIKIKTEPLDDTGTHLTLEQQAAKEIIEDLHATDKLITKTEELALPLAENENLRGKEESTLEDYDKIPVDMFGLAMLRGMGWQPGKGIGKNEKVVAAVVPELRPKGMGLGADKVALKKKPVDTKKAEEELKIQKGTFVKFVAGKQTNSYGEIEGFDEDAGRLIVKMALGGNIVSVNEFVVQPVTKAEYTKNAKVLNAKKYEEYKEKEASGKQKLSSSDKSDNGEDGERTHRKEKKKKSSKYKSKDKEKEKSRKRRSSESNSGSDYGKRSRGRSRSTSKDSHKFKKTKKSKKHKKYDSSPERSSKKNKKDKDRERTRDKKSRDSECVDRKKRKKHRRSKSRS